MLFLGQDLVFLGLLGFRPQQGLPWCLGAAQTERPPACTLVLQAAANTDMACFSFPSFIFPMPNPPG